MSALDTSVVNTILPVVNQDFNSQVATVEWVVVIYLLLISSLLTSFGRLGDIHGHKKVYITGFVVFISSSVICGLAPSIPALIGARGLQAIGAAILSANSPAILTKNFPGNQRGQALGMQATMTYLGLTVGPSLGGLLTDHFGWRSVFFINIPVGLVALWLSVRHIPKDRDFRKLESFDWRGAVLFMGGLGSLLLALNQGHNFGWRSPMVILLILGAIILLALLIRQETQTSNPMLDLRLFMQRTFSSAVTSAVINYICVYSIIFLMPFYLIDGRGMSPSQAGLLLTAQPIVMAIVAPISGTISDRIGTRLPSALGMAILSLGLFGLSRIQSTTPSNLIVLGLLTTGLGIGIFISPNNSALMGSAPRHRQGIAAGILATARNVGMVLGVGFAGAVFTTMLGHSTNNQTLALFQAIRIAFLAAGVVAILGIFTSAIRTTKIPPAKVD